MALAEDVQSRLQTQVEELLAQRDYVSLRQILLPEEAVDIADLALELEGLELATFFRLLSKDQAAEVFVYLSSDQQEELIKLYSDQELSEILDGLYNDDLVEILDELPAQVAKRVLKQADPSRRDLVNRLLQYPEESAGSIMTTEYMKLSQAMTVAEALDKLRNIKQRVEMIYTCFVTNDSRVLEGVVYVADLLRARDDQYLWEIMNRQPHFARTTDDQEEVARIFRDFDLLALPVVDTEHRLVGIVTVDDAVEVFVEEVSEDHAYMAAMQPAEIPYPETSVFNNARRRIFWLMLLMLSGTLNALILRHYEAVYVALPMLVALMPLLTAAGGNAASQTTSVAIVASATGDIKAQDFTRVVWKELRISLICGLALATTNAALVFFRNEHNATLALAIFIAFLATIVMAKVMAVILLFTAKALHLDPAMVVAPVITTVVDICALLLYYGVAGRLFHISLY